MKWLKTIFQSRVVLIFMFLLVADAKAFDLSAAINLIERKDYQRAESILRQYLAVKEDAETLYLLGFLLIETYGKAGKPMFLTAKSDVCPDLPSDLPLLTYL